MTTEAQRESAAFWGQFLHDPVKFVGTFWPHIVFAPYQADILKSVATNTETWVHSAHETGKTFIAALAALWWFATRPSKVIVISATERQLKNAMWGEITKQLEEATLKGKKFDFGFAQTDLELRYKDESDSPNPQYFLRLMVCNQPEALHGVHLPKIALHNDDRDVGTVFFISEEASGIHESLFPVIASSRHSALFIGNPTRDLCEFARVCKAGPIPHPNDPRKLHRRIIHISTEHSPNVIIGKEWERLGKIGPKPEAVRGIISYDEYLVRKQTWSDYEKKTRLYGLFPEEEGQMLFPSSWLKVATDLGDMLRQRMESKRKPIGRPFSLGVDTSEGGGDKTAWYVWGRFGVVYRLSKETPNTAEIAGTTIQLMRKYHIKPWYVAFDSGGGGKQIADALRDKGYEEIRDIEFGGRADDPAKYMNKRAELYGLLREAMQLSLADDKQTIRGRIGRMLKGVKGWAHPRAWCASIPSDAALLREDLAVLPLLRDQEGRLRMLPKDKPRGKASGRMEKCVRELLGGRSPDEGDACVLAYYAWLYGKDYDQAASVDGPLIYG